MGKIKAKAGTPVLGQLLSLISRNDFNKALKETGADFAVKKLRSWDLMVTMLFAVMHRSKGLRELTSGLAGFSEGLKHLGLSHLPAKSTVSDANMVRPPELFARVFADLHRRYKGILSDSSLPKNERWLAKLFLVDSTTITLFKEIMKACGRTPANGKRKGGVKVHMGMWLQEELPSLVRITKAATNDRKFMPYFRNMAKGSILVFDKAYLNYELYHHWISSGVGFITRLHRQCVVTILEDRTVSEAQKALGVLLDQWVLLGPTDGSNPLRVRLVTYYDEVNNREFQFITNVTKLGAFNIAQAYKQRWQIELLFKRLKQNLKFTDFLGDNENAIRIQIWCALIADLLITIKRKGFKFKVQPAYSTITGLVRMHLMRYVDLHELLLCPNDPSLFSNPESAQLTLFSASPP